MKTLDDKVVVITGAGSGIGRALALNLARRGSLLALSDVDEAGLAETVALAEKAGAAEVRSDRLDVADRDAMARYALDVVQHFGRVNVVINNAGVALTGDFTDLEYADIDWIVGVNFWGVLHGTKEFLPHLIASGDGHVVNLSSLFGLISMPGPVDLQRHQVRRPRHDRGAARGDARSPATRSASPRCTPAASRPRSSATPGSPPRRTRRRPSRALRQEAGQDDARAGRRDHRQRHPEEQGPRPRRPRRARACTTWPSCSARATRTSSPRRRPSVVPAKVTILE